MLLDYYYFSMKDKLNMKADLFLFWRSNISINPMAEFLFLHKKNRLKVQHHEIK